MSERNKKKSEVMNLLGETYIYITLDYFVFQFFFILSDSFPLFTSIYIYIYIQRERERERERIEIERSINSTDC